MNIFSFAAIAWSPEHHGLLASGCGTDDHCIRFWNTLTGYQVKRDGVIYLKRMRFLFLTMRLNLIMPSRVKVKVNLYMIVWFMHVLLV
jgi:hypothetical protein